MRFPPPPGLLPVVETAGRAYALLWRHRRLHARAIWPPVLFLVTAEFLYHRIVGNAEGLAGLWHAVRAAPWYMPACAVLAWLAGLKFLLSFSISWRRHLLLDERFDPFFFKAPFWRYLGFLLLTDAWIAMVAMLAFLSAGLVAAGLAAAGLAAAGPVAVAPAREPAIIVLLAVGLPTALFVAWAVARQVPFFTALALDPPQPGWRDSVRAMRGNAWRYLLAFVLAMLPVVALDLLLDAALTHVGADRHAVPVALGESAFRQAMLFAHFSLGASLGAITTTTVLPGRPRGKR